MATKRINVLIYSGPGTSLNSIRQTTWSLRRLLGPNYAVLTITSDQILKEPWTASCALLVVPGGADLHYCKALNGDGNRRIKQYVRLGGKYLGFCAGGYYGSAKCEFEVGRTAMEVVGERELAFFPGTCRGLAFPGFVYASEKGAKAVKLKADRAAFGGSALEGFRSYYNGGGVFVDAAKFKDRGVETLARFEDDLAVDAGEDGAAVVYCNVGDGAAVLTGPHPEFSGINLNREEPSNPQYSELVDAIREDDESRTAFMKACLDKLGLEVSQEAQAIPSLSRLHLSSSQPKEIAELVQSWRDSEMLTIENDEEYINGENDKFHLEKVDRWSVKSMAEAVIDAMPETIKATVTLSASSSTAELASKTTADLSSDRSPDIDSSNAPYLRLVPHDSALPDSKETPQFNHHAFFSNLKHYVASQHGLAGDYGRILLYGEVITSTNTLLEKNPKLLSQLPIGTTATATTQIAGRGRGTNVWVSPPGSLMFSTVLKHSFSLSSSAPVVFVQYLAAMAVVAGVKAYGHGERSSTAYEKMPIKLKWPNDIYALDPTKPATEQQYTKIGGILVNSSYAGADYTLVVGIGLNTNNAAPTTSLSHLAAKLSLPPFALEKLLASILVQFEALYARFCRSGFDRWFEQRYYADWLHMDQIVTLETEGGTKAKIKGITTDWGLLVAEELGSGRRIALQSDSNSFDFFKGLVKRKI